jgi:hypothetical protein
MQAFENRDGEWSQHVAAAAKAFATEISVGLHAQDTRAASPS